MILSGNIMANQPRWRNPNFPFPMSFPTRILLYIVVDLIMINLVVLYLHQNLPLSLVILIILIEIVSLAIAMVFWVPVYKLKW